MGRRLGPAVARAGDDQERGSESRRGNPWRAAGGNDTDLVPCRRYTRHSSRATKKKAGGQKKAALSSEFWNLGPPGVAMTEVTRILSAVEQGDPHAAGQLLPLVYEELRRLAAQRLAQENPGQTLQATALVHEAYLRLVDVKQTQTWNSRGHFFAAAAEAMRR